MNGLIYPVLVVLHLAQPSKCFVLVSPPFVNQAKSLFGCLSVKVVTGHQFLGGFIGDINLRQDFVLQKVHQWSSHVRGLSAVACKQPRLLILYLPDLYS